MVVAVVATDGAGGEGAGAADGSYGAGIDDGGDCSSEAPDPSPAGYRVPPRYRYPLRPPLVAYRTRKLRASGDRWAVRYPCDPSLSANRDGNRRPIRPAALRSTRRSLYPFYRTEGTSGKACLEEVVRPPEVRHNGEEGSPAEDRPPMGRKRSGRDFRSPERPPSRRNVDAVGEGALRVLLRRSSNPACTSWQSTNSF